MIGVKTHDPMPRVVAQRQIGGANEPCVLQEPDIFMCLTPVAVRVFSADEDARA